MQIRHPKTSAFSYSTRAALAQQQQLTPYDARSKLPGQGERSREVRISCPDATGLGCDLARLLLDFALLLTAGEQAGLLLAFCCQTTDSRCQQATSSPMARGTLVCRSQQAL